MFTDITIDMRTCNDTFMQNTDTRRQSDSRTSTETDATTKNYLCFLEVFTHVSQNVFSCVGAFSSSLFWCFCGWVQHHLSHMTDEETLVFGCAAARPSWLDRGEQTFSCRWTMLVHYRRSTSASSSDKALNIHAGCPSTKCCLSCFEPVFVDGTEHHKNVWWRLRRYLRISCHFDREEARLGADSSQYFFYLRHCSAWQ